MLTIDEQTTFLSYNDFIEKISRVEQSWCNRDPLELFPWSKKLITSTFRSGYYNVDPWQARGTLVESASMWLFSAFNQ